MCVPLLFFGVSVLFMLRMAPFLRMPPPFTSDSSKGGAFLRTWRKVSGRRPENFGYFASLQVRKRVKTSISQGFGAVGAQNFSPAALKRSIFGLNLMYLRISILRQIGVLKNGPPFYIRFDKRGGILNINSTDRWSPRLPFEDGRKFVTDAWSRMRRYDLSLDFSFQTFLTPLIRGWLRGARCGQNHT